MYSHCLACRSHLGSNDVIEALPIGRRIAFDSAKGRLWVVCPKCRQWNLTPFEERWEAVEEGERLFRGAKLRVQGEEIGLARLPGELELVRIGRPQLPELAAWRYGTMRRIRRREVAIGVAGGAAAGALMLSGGVVVTAGIGGAFALASLALQAAGIHRLRQISDVRIPNPDGPGDLVITLNERGFTRIVPRPESEGSWGLEVPYRRIAQPGDHWIRSSLNLNAEGIARFHGAEAVPVLGRLLPARQGSTARPRVIEDAVAMISDAGGPDRWFATAAARTREWGARQTWGDTGAVFHLPGAVRLALVIAANEESERRAMDGELAALEQQWRDAEEIAAIADDLLLPASVTHLIARFKGETRG